MQILNVLIERNVGQLGETLKYYNPFDISLKRGCRVFVPLKGQKIVGMVDSLDPVPYDISKEDNRFKFKLKPILEIIDEKPFLNEELFQTIDAVSDFYIGSKSMLFGAILPKPYAAKSSYINGPKIAYEKFIKINSSSNISCLTKKQMDVFNFVKEKKEVSSKEISPSILKTLINKNILIAIKKEKKRFEAQSFTTIEKNVLTENQKECVNGILASKNKTCLLQGITGSGKTEVYMELIKKTLKQNKTVLFLVPEISLTPYMISYFYSRFEDKLAVIHSGLTPSQYFDEYRKIINKEVQVVLGVRKSIFAPLTNIGLIIIDEEHDNAYKQNEPPFYDARVVAQIRRRYYDAILVYGSATPSVEQKNLAEKKVISFFELKERINEVKSIPTTIVDMKNPFNFYKDSIIFSKILIEKIKEKLNKKEQIILLVEKKGYSYLMCPKCGLTFKCRNCNTTLTYYKYKHKLICNRCGAEYNIPTSCPSCHCDTLYEVGFGIEKVYEELKKFFPSAKILRLDKDISEQRGEVDKIISSFFKNETDILIGTSMVSKGLDFKNVTLVGLVLVDIALNVPSFKSNENTFSLIFQTIGRSGRDSLKGEAVLQTFYKNYFAIKTASNQDYETFYKMELEERKNNFNPPFYNIIKIHARGNNDRDLLNVLKIIKDDIVNKKLDSTFILGPTLDQGKITMSFKSYSLLIKSKNIKEVKEYLKEAKRALIKTSNVKLYFNINSED